MAQITYKGQDNVDFKTVAYAYLLEREGYRNKVYKDSKGIDTVGIGHKVEPGDNLNYGDVISNDQVQGLFNDDYDRLGVDAYVQEILDAGFSYNMGLAVASFIWAHGLGSSTHIGYKDSQLHAGLLDGSLTADNIQSYLADNWDKASSVNSKRNAKDFAIGFSSTPWTPGFH